MGCDTIEGGPSGPSDGGRNPRARWHRVNWAAVGGSVAVGDKHLSKTCNWQQHRPESKATMAARVSNEGAGPSSANVGGGRHSGRSTS